MLTTLLILILLTSNVFAAGLNSTKYLLKNEAAPFSGFLIEQDRMEKATAAVKELAYVKRIYQMEMSYRDEREKNIALSAELQLVKTKGEAAAVEKGLKAEVAKKSAWYRQPWAVAAGTAILFIVTGSLVP
jgi:hypothetical protein